MAETVERLVVEIEAKIADFKANMVKAGGQLDATRKRFGSLGRVVSRIGATVSKVAARFRASVISMKGAIIGLVSGIVIRRIGNFINQITLMGDEIAKTARKVGISTETLSGLQLASELAGSSFRELVGGFRRLSSAASDARDGLAESQRAFDRLGVSVTDNEGQLRSMEDIFFDVSDAISKTTSETEAAALAQDVLGRAGLNLIPLLKGGSAALREQIKEARRLGIVFTKEDAVASEEFRDSITRLKFSLFGLGRTIFADVVPVITASFERMKESFIDTRETGKGFAESIGKFIKGLAFVTIISVELMRKVWDGLQLTWLAVKSAFFSVQIAMRKGLSFILTAFRNSIDVIGPAFSDLFSNILGFMKTFSIAFIIGITNLFKNVLSAVRTFAGDAINLLSRVSAFPGIKQLEAGFQSIVGGTDRARKSIEGFSKTSISSISGVNTTIGKGVEASNKLRLTINKLASENERDVESRKAVNEELIQTVAAQGNATEAYDRAKNAILELNAQIDANKQKIAEQTEATIAGAEAAKPAIETTKTAWETFLNDSVKLTKQFSDLAINTINQFASGIGDAFARTIVAGQKFKQSLQDLMRSLASSIISSLVRIIITAIVARIALSFFGVPSVDLAGAASTANQTIQGISAIAGANLPKAARGGIVTSPTVALVGEAGPEAIIPLDRAGGFGMGEQTIILEVDGEQLAQMVVPNMPDVLRAQFGATF